jgi:hypothetical protein
MKCENCPFYTVEGTKNGLDWCKLYNAKAPVNGCEVERDGLIKQYQLMQEFFETRQKNE